MPTELCTKTEDELTRGGYIVINDRSSREIKRLTDGS